MNRTTTYDRQIAAQRYSAMVQEVRDVSGHAVVNGVGETTTQHHIIELQIWNGANFVATAYMWADTLFVFGFYTVNGWHQFFNDATLYQDAQQMLGIIATMLPWNGNYTTMPGGTAAERQNFGYTGTTLYNALLDLSQIQNRIQNGTRDTASRNIIRMIGAVAEAARFQRVRNTVYNGILNDLGGYLSNDETTYENNWDRISTWVTNLINGVPQAPLVLGLSTYYTVAGLIAQLYYVEIKNQRL
ncbi:ribosome inactivating protein [Catellatospora citrea]|nr:ribosome inactivating protein [Catellatospora citrea]